MKTKSWIIVVITSITASAITIYLCVLCICHSEILPEFAEYSRPGRPIANIDKEFALILPHAYNAMVLDSGIFIYLERGCTSDKPSSVFVVKLVSNKTFKPPPLALGIKSATKKTLTLTDNTEWSVSMYLPLNSGEVELRADPTVSEQLKKLLVTPATEIIDCTPDIIKISKRQIANVTVSQLMHSSDLYILVYYDKWNQIDILKRRHV